MLKRPTDNTAFKIALITSYLIHSNPLSVEVPLGQGWTLTVLLSATVHQTPHGHSSMHVFSRL